MAIYKVTVIERVVEVDEATLTIEAETPKAAARIALNATDDECAVHGGRFISLPDGQGARLDPREVVHGEIVAAVSSEDEITMHGQFGYSIFFEPDLADNHVLREILARAVLDTTRPGEIEPARRLLAFLKEQAR